MTSATASFWGARTGREKVLIGCLGLTCLGWALFAGVWQPLQKHRVTLTEDIAQYARTSAALSTASPGDASFSAVAPDAPLPSILSDTAMAFQLTIRRLQPTQNAAEIVLEDAPFETVLMWVDTLERDQGLRVIAIDMTRRPEPGVVATTLTIGR
jgi:general secretion pathway protein M